MLPQIENFPLLDL